MPAKPNDFWVIIPVSIDYFRHCPSCMRQWKRCAVEANMKIGWPFDHFLLWLSREDGEWDRRIDGHHWFIGRINFNIREFNKSIFEGKSHSVCVNFRVAEKFRTSHRNWDEYRRICAHCAYMHIYIDCTRICLINCLLRKKHCTFIACYERNERTECVCVWKSTCSIRMLATANQANSQNEATQISLSFPLRNQVKK